jgi:hypothetical protein
MPTLTFSMPLLSRRPGFASVSVHVRYVVDKVALEQIFSPSTSTFPVTIIPPCFHTHILSGGWAISPLMDAIQRHSLTQSTWKQPQLLFYFSYFILNTGFWLRLRGGIVQSVPCNCYHFLIYCAPHLSSNHTRFIHQNSLLWLQRRHLAASGEKLGEKYPLNFAYQYLYHILRYQ